MRVSRLRIDGFRGVKSADLSFGQHSILVGPNSVGKTTIIEALALLFGRDRLVRDLTEHDFFGSTPEEATRIIIVATVTDFDGDEPQQHGEWFGMDRGVEKWLDPEGALHPSRTSDTCKLAVQLGLGARFNTDTLEVEIVRFFVDDDADIGDPFHEDEHRHPIRGKTLQELGFFLVSATRTWDRWISFSSELFKKVVATTGSVPATAVRNERLRVWEPTEKLEEATGISTIVTEINEELAHLISASPKLRLRLTSTDSDGVLRAVVPHFQEGNGPTIPSSRQGSGLASLQSLLLLMQFGAARKARSECFVLAVEEPELHVPPALQKRLVNRLNAVCNQTIMTTHSPVVASMFPPNDVLFLRNHDGVLTGAALSTGAAPPTNHEQHLFYGWRDRLVAALMHEYVLVPEGISDLAWLEALQTSIELRQQWAAAGDESLSFGSFVGITPTADAKVVETFRVTSKVHDGVVCLVDGDGPGHGYISDLGALTPKPRVVLVWPDGWTIENVVGWIASADTAVVLPLLSIALEAALADIPALQACLLTKKSYSPTHQKTAEILSGNAACRARIAELLNDVTDVARQAPGTRKRFVHWPEKSAGQMQVWRFQP
jgi:hypothetical protein